MDPYRAITVTSVILAVCLVSAFIMAPSGMAAEYSNEAVTDTGDPVYWLDRGGLYATYGSYKAAIKAYDKALELNPNSDKAYFNRGLSYAEIGDLNQAMLDINKAISLNSGKENYYYARGRVQLLSGNKDEALKDFKKAADMGDLDAKKYLTEMQ